MDECKERKVNEWEVGCMEEEDTERKRKLTIRQAEGAGDERIRRGSTGSGEGKARENE